MVPIQSKMARMALGLGIRELAEIAQVAPATISRFEAGEELKLRTIAALQSALESAGVIFADENGEGPGVRLRRRTYSKMTPGQFKMEGDDFARKRLPALLRELKADRMTIVRTADRMSLHVGAREIGYVELNGGSPKIDPPLAERPKPSRPTMYTGPT